MGMGRCSLEVFAVFLGEFLVGFFVSSSVLMMVVVFVVVMMGITMSVGVRHV